MRFQAVGVEQPERWNKWGQAEKRKWLRKQEQSITRSCHAAPSADPGTHRDDHFALVFSWAFFVPQSIMACLHGLFADQNATQSDPIKAAASASNTTSVSCRMFEAVQTFS